MSLPAVCWYFIICTLPEEAEVTWFKDTNKIKPKKKGDKKYKVDWDMDSDVYYLQVCMIKLNDLTLLFKLRMIRYDNSLSGW